VSSQGTTRRKDQGAGQPALLADYLTEPELAKQLRVSIRTLRNWRARQSGPPFVKVAKRVEYPRSGVPPWLASLEQKPGRARRA
jgi:hypothetical protein